MPSLIDILVASLVVTGTFLIAVAALGLVRMPDVFCRMHTTGKAGTLGVVTVILATVVHFAGGDQDVAFRGLLAIFFQFLTSPTATHLLARAAYLCEYPLSERTSVDELKAFLPSQPDEVFNRE